MIMEPDMKNKASKTEFRRKNDNQWLVDKLKPKKNT